MRFAELTQEVQIARSENIYFDTGLAKGRRRLNEQYKEAAAKITEDGGERCVKYLLSQPCNRSCVVIPLILFAVSFCR